MLLCEKKAIEMGFIYSRRAKICKKIEQEAVSYRLLLDFFYAHRAIRKLIT